MLTSLLLILIDKCSLLFKIKYFSMFGGGDVREAVERILKEVIVTKLAREYNMKGLKGKRKFAGLQMMTVLYSKLK